MLKPLFLATLIITGLSSCSSKINQYKNKKPEGKWVITDSLESVYTATGRYHKGNEKGKWRYFKDGNLIKTERYRGYNTKTVFYHPNGQVYKKGKTQYDSDAVESHWYYIGKWSYYKMNGQLDSTIVYKKENTSKLLKKPLKFN
ncbi:hypothetical protein FFWV33_09030 [Flavobacterium faecale]|uniref:Nicotinic acid mononucleotide adenyltransferase n=1 Tax=Flavobacterium faecale TaxID=1355330 RepID=A0A2S1LD45_9FLAO|nr:hypothetical protein [Flavobacterium faecale]AWG21669.1 hypothetical protein FFWV33_09030 [Flavobacterium faecale]